jgi:hypothetical protein
VSRFGKLATEPLVRLSMRFAETLAGRLDPKFVYAMFVHLDDKAIQQAVEETYFEPGQHA